MRGSLDVTYFGIYIEVQGAWAMDLEEDLGGSGGPEKVKRDGRGQRGPGD